MSHPLVYEINTRCWLRELAEKHASTLADVPQSHFTTWRQLGFTHIWLMGVWTTGPRSRACALDEPALRQRYSEVLPGWQPEDVGGSPYAIADYQVAPALGGEQGLAQFRKRLHDHGMGLILDFVPNHLGLDHRWLGEKPHLFVQSPVRVPGTFAQETAGGVRWLAHGKDPYFDGWTDTVQLDYRRADTRAEMLGLLKKVAAQCDGVRCDMAMLLLSAVFAKTWNHLPVVGNPPMPSSPEFWMPALRAVKQAFPEFLFLAEAYWGSELRLQELGFDYTYDKVLYDGLVAHDAAAVSRHLSGLPANGLSGSCHFLENHDEPRIANLLSRAEQWAAALLVLALPGLRLLHDGQLSGARRHNPVQLARRFSEPEVAETRAMYEQLLEALRDCGLSGGGPSIAPGRTLSKGVLLSPRDAWPGNPTARNILLVQWQAELPDFHLAAVNLAPHRSQCYAPLSAASLSEHDWLMKDRLSDEQYLRPGANLREQGLYLDLEPNAAQLFHFSVTDSGIDFRPRNGK